MIKPSANTGLLKHPLILEIEQKNNTQRQTQINEESQKQTDIPNYNNQNSFKMFNGRPLPIQKVGHQFCDSSFMGSHLINQFSISQKNSQKQLYQSSKNQENSSYNHHKQNLSMLDDNENNNNVSTNSENNIEIIKNINLSKFKNNKDSSNSLNKKSVSNNKIFSNTHFLGGEGNLIVQNRDLLSFYNFQTSQRLNKSQVLNKAVQTPQQKESSQTDRLILQDNSYHVSSFSSSKKQLKQNSSPLKCKLQEDLIFEKINLFNKQNNQNQKTYQQILLQENTEIQNQANYYQKSFKLFKMHQNQRPISAKNSPKMQILQNYNQKLRILSSQLNQENTQEQVHPQKIQQTKYSQFSPQKHSDQRLIIFGKQKIQQQNNHSLKGYHHQGQSQKVFIAKNKNRDKSKSLYDQKLKAISQLSINGINQQQFNQKGGKQLLEQLKNQKYQKQQGKLNNQSQNYIKELQQKFNLNLNNSSEFDMKNNYLNFQFHEFQPWQNNEEERISDLDKIK